MSCGAELTPLCPSCGAENPGGAKFCMECGAALGEGTPAATPAAASPTEAPPEERRQATIVFADLSGYTAAAERMDPEAVKALVDRTLRRLGDAIERFGGSIDKFIGDNVMGVFGAPTAHEDDPERAVRAGLAMQEAMEGANRESQEKYGVEFSLRVGINSGEVMAGAVGDRYTVMGDAVNVAARLQGAGRPESVTVGESTYQATGEAISYERLEPLTLKGKEEPVPAWEATGVLSEPRRRGGRAQTPLIGREEEAGLLSSLAERVEREGRPYLVTVIGQAGVGKSRLLRELMSNLELLGRSHRRSVAGSARPYGSGIAYWALAEVLNDEFEIRDTDTPEAAWEKLRAGVTQADERARRRVRRRAQRRPARHSARPRAPRGAAPVRGGPTADARGALLGCPRRGRGHRPAQAAGAGDRRHPLGRRGDARPDRPPDALGPRPAPARLPEPRRAARSGGPTGAAAAGMRRRSRWSR